MGLHWITDVGYLPLVANSERYQDHGVALQYAIANSAEDNAWDASFEGGHIGQGTLQEAIALCEEHEHSEDKPEPPTPFEWQPFSQAPKDGTRVLAWWTDGRTEVLWFGSLCQAWYDSNDEYHGDDLPNIYLPLPEPSEEEKKVL